MGLNEDLAGYLADEAAREIAGIDSEARIREILVDKYNPYVLLALRTDEALGFMRKPGLDNDGGPSDILEDVKALIYTLEATNEDCMEESTSED